jgi:hypothetical protein
MANDNNLLKQLNQNKEKMQGNRAFPKEVIKETEKKNPYTKQFIVRLDPEMVLEIDRLILQKKVEGVQMDKATWAREVFRKALDAELKKD